MLLQCPVALSLGKKLFRESHWNLDYPGSCNALMCQRNKFFRGRKMGMVSGKCAVVAVFWVVGMERNKRNLVEARDEDVDQLWDRVRFWIRTGSYTKKD